jgi:glycogen(starch) synthase
MKLAHINHRYAPFVGGSERYMQEISEALAGDGHEVHVVTSNAFDLEYFWDRRRRPIDAPAIEQLNGVSVHRVPVVHLPLGPLVFQGSRRLMGEASRLPVLPATGYRMVSRRLPYMPDLEHELLSLGSLDLVHAANIGIEGLGITAQQVARKRDIPFLFTPFIHLGQDNDAVARRYVSMPHQKGLLKSANSIVVMTDLEASFVISLGIDPDCIVVTGVGVDPGEVTGGDAERFRAEFGITGRLVGVASAVAFDKGSRDLVLAVAALRRRGHDVELMLAGPVLQQFETWFASLPEHDRAGIHLPGFISPEQKRDMLAAIDILAMPSRTESFGIAYLEGWANSKPVIAARAGAVPELVRDGENGRLVEFGDPAGLANTILDLLSDPARSATMAEAGRKMTLSKYTWPAVTARVRRAYEHALGHPLIGRSDRE